MRSDIFAPDFREAPYWWDAAPPAALENPPLPKRVDVAIVGSGITGMTAARVLARAGRSVAIFDANDLGTGAARRNAGFVGRTSKHRFVDIAEEKGLPFAIRVYRELAEGFAAVGETIRAENIECGFTPCGRFIPALSASDLRALEREYDAQRRHLGIEFQVVAPGEQRRELATDMYHGGIVIPDLASLHPGLYHAGLLERARAAGVAMFARSPVLRIDTSGPHDHVLSVPGGTVRARDVIVATNGYTSQPLSFLRRRVVPFDAYMIATESLPRDLIDALIPGGRTCIDTRRDPLYVRRSPDGTRILFGGLTGSRPGSIHEKAERLVEKLRAILPDLAGVRISRAWTGRCAATFDMYPHMAVRDGVHYVGGYCFVGIPTGTNLGRKVALSILGEPGAESVFADMPFPGHPLYTGNAWFVPGLMRYWNWLDRRDESRAA